MFFVICSDVEHFVIHHNTILDISTMASENCEYLYLSHIKFFYVNMTEYIALRNT